MDLNSIQKKLIEVLSAHNIPAEWSEDVGEAHVQLGNTEVNPNDFAILEFDDPDSLEGCKLSTPTGLEGNKEKYRKAWEIAIGVYYASIGGSTGYGEETNAQFNEWARCYGGLINA